MIDIPITAQTRTTLTALSQAKALIDASSKHITTGVRIASPFDGVSAYFDAKDLSARATRLLKTKDDLTNAATVTGGTLANIDEITALLNSAKLLATAAKGGAVSGATSTTATGNVVTTQASVITGTIGGVLDNDSFTVTHGGTTTTITNTNGSTFTTLVAQINAITDLSATVSDGNAIVITAADGNDITIANVTNTLATDLGLSTSTNGIVATNSTRTSAEGQVDLILSKITTLVGEATYLGTNLLKTTPDTLSVALNENGGNILNITGIASSSTALSLTAVDALDSYATDTGINTSIAEIDAALVTLANTRSGISTNDTIINSRLGFVDEIVTLLNEGSDKLVATDLTTESANLLALQTRHDLSVTGVGLFFKDGTVLTALLQLGR